MKHMKYLETKIDLQSASKDNDLQLCI